MYAEMLSDCIALSHNLTDKSLAIYKKSQNESPNGEKKITSEQARLLDMIWNSNNKISDYSNCNDYFKTIEVKKSCNQ